jgi:hypothetical protein
MIALLRRSILPNANRFGDLRRSTLSWCRRTRISASDAARDRNRPIKTHQINLQRSLIGSEYQPIRGRGQPFWVCGRDKSTPPLRPDMIFGKDSGINGVYHHVSHEHLPMYLADLASAIQSARANCLRASSESVWPIDGLTKPRSIRQKARRFIAWRKRKI